MARPAGAGKICQPRNLSAAFPGVPVNMKRTTLITLAAALLPLAGFAEEKALWEVRARLDGGKNPQINGWIKELFAKDGSAAMIGEKAVFRIAGFENEATPEEDWVAEVRDLADPAAVMKEIESEGKPDGQGRFLMEEEGVSFLVWRTSGGGSSLHSTKAAVTCCAGGIPIASDPRAWATSAPKTRSNAAAPSPG